MTSSLLKMVGQCDLCVVDLDQCIYPRFTQTTLGALLLLRSLRTQHRYLPRFLSGAAYITFTRFFQLLGKKPTSYELMSAFCRVIKGIPLSLLEEAAFCLPRMGPRSWRVTLGKIASRMSVFLLTFAIEPIARAYGEARDFRGRKIFQFWKGTQLKLEGEVIKECIFSYHSLSPEAKMEAMQEFLNDGGFSRPLIIGHGEDEVVMARYARKVGGGSIGFARAGGEIEGFEIILHGNTWEKIAAAI